TVVVITPGAARPATYQGTIGPDGSIDLPVIRPWLLALNDAIATTRGAIDSAGVGNAWTSSTVLPSNDGEASVVIPLKVIVTSKMASATATQLSLAAAGGLHAIVHETGSIATPHVALYLRLNANFVNGMLQVSEGSLQGSMTNGAVTGHSDDSAVTAQSAGQAGKGGEAEWSLSLAPAK
ncbi:MAG TPA: hypothetical protein VGD50_02050, partial [Candidatus Baltobacteraceae bacterium]